MNPRALKHPEAGPSPPPGPLHRSPSPDVVAEAIGKARTAQRAWAATPLRSRLEIVRALRKHIANDAGDSLAAAAAAVRERPQAEALSSEVLPLLDGCRFLEREAARVLAQTNPGTRGRPFWLTGSRIRIRREPFGVILVIGPANYPLFLPGIQLLQALVAGNAAAVKPAAGASAPMRLLADALAAAGLPPGLVPVLPEEKDAARRAIDHGVAKVVLTGSADTGRAVLALCREKLIPATMELSGCDAVFVRSDAIPEDAAAALFFGLQMNDGRTCIAPRRVFAHRDIAGSLETALRALPDPDAEKNIIPANPRLVASIRDALAGGARAVIGGILPVGDSISAPLVLADVPVSSPLCREDFFAPVASIISVAGDDEALALDDECPCALGASVFGRDEGAALALAGRVNAGCVTVNDLIVPTADPRLPFGGRGCSGFGSTRGAQGLLEMTLPKAIAARKAGGALPHFRPVTIAHETLFRSYIRLAHGSGLGNRFKALKRVIRALRKISMPRKQENASRDQKT